MRVELSKMAIFASFCNYIIQTVTCNATTITCINVKKLQFKHVLTASCID